MRNLTLTLGKTQVLSPAMAAKHSTPMAQFSCCPHEPTWPSGFSATVVKLKALPAGRRKTSVPDSTAHSGQVGMRRVTESGLRQAKRLHGRDSCKDDNLENSTSFKIIL